MGRSGALAPAVVASPLIVAPLALSLGSWRQQSAGALAQCRGAQLTFAAPLAGRQPAAVVAATGTSAASGRRQELAAEQQSQGALLGGAALLAGALAGGRRGGRATTARRSKGAITERPLLDQLVTSSVRAIEAAELARVSASSETPSEDNGNWAGEPREWADASSLTQRISTVSQIGPLAQLKQFIAERLAGDYDRDAVGGLINEKVASSRVMMFSFSTCPFCLRAKQLLREEYGVEPEVYECDLEPDGYAVRAELGRLTGRTSMPSTWLGPDVLLGGCNDGGLGGVATLHAAGKLEPLLSERGALDSGTPWWLSLWGPPPEEVAGRKRRLRALCAEAPPNGVGASEDQKAEVEKAASELEPYCPSAPARGSLEGTWDLLYCTAPGGSSGKVGPFVGQVSQTFLDEERFKNEVELFGALKISLQAVREVLDDVRIRVTFRELVFSLFGTEVFRKESKGSGVWKQRFVDADLRVMDTPSLFVLKKRAP